MSRPKRACMRLRRPPEGCRVLGQEGGRGRQEDEWGEDEWDENEYEDEWIEEEGEDESGEDERS